MPKSEVRIIEASKTKIVLEGVIGKDERFAIPKIARGIIPADTLVRLTIEPIP